MSMWEQLAASGEKSRAPRIPRPGYIPVERPQTDNPWGLAPSEVRLMEAVVQVGHYKKAARLVGLTPKTVECYMRDIRRKMDIDHQIVAVVTWDRWSRSQSAGLGA